jgi:integrase
MNLKMPPGMKFNEWKTAKGEVKRAYYYRLPRSQGRKTVPLGTDYQLALKKWAELHGAQVEPAKAGTVGDLYEKYMVWANNRAFSKLSPRTISDRENYWGKADSGKLKDTFEHVPVDSLKPEWMLQYFEARSSQVSAKKELKFLSVMCNWGKARGLMLAANPTNDIMRLLSVDEKRDIYVEDVWFNLVWKHGDQLVKDAMDFTYICGNRPNETERASKADIQNGVIEIRLAKTEKKGNKSKRLAVEGELKAYIDRQKSRPVSSMWLVSAEDGQKLKVSGARFRRRFADARDKAEKEAAQMGIRFERFYLMDIRAKAATDTAEKHGIEAARKLLGHTTQKQTADYIRSIKGVSATAIEKIIRQQVE